jgi:hypothetical protein
MPDDDDGDVVIDPNTPPPPKLQSSPARPGAPVPVKPVVRPKEPPLDPKQYQSVLTPLDCRRPLRNLAIPAGPNAGVHSGADT